MQVMSAPHFWFAAVAVDFFLSKFGADANRFRRGPKRVFLIDD